MAAKLTDDERTHIVDLLHQGRGCTDIARDVGRSPDTISRIARSIGHSFGATNLAHAREARSAYCAERRAGIAASLTEAAERLLAELEGEYLVFNFGGRDNVYAEHLLSAPPVEAKRALVATVRDAMRTVIDIDRHDNRNEDGLAAVDSWLREMVGGSPT